MATLKNRKQSRLHRFSGFFSRVSLRLRAFARAFFSRRTDGWSGIEDRGTGISNLDTYGCTDTTQTKSIAAISQVFSRVSGRTATWRLAPLRELFAAVARNNTDCTEGWSGTGGWGSGIADMEYGRRLIFVQLSR